MTRETFVNLARRWPDDGKVDPFVNESIKAELTEAGISILNLNGPQKEYTEVPYSMVGVLGREKEIENLNTMSKFWDSQWVDRTEVTRGFDFLFVRRWYYWSVTGVVPLRVAEELYADPIGVKKVRVSGHCGCPPPSEQARVEGGRKVVTGYHIDNQEGLNLFVATVKKHGLVQGSLPTFRTLAEYCDYSEFCTFVAANLGDVVVLNEGKFISPKLNNYWRTWRQARDTA